MTEWWTYSLRDFLPFSRDTWLRLFELYNDDIWPLPLIFALSGLFVLWRIMYIKHEGEQRAAIAFVALAWALVGWQFHWTRYANLNWAAAYFAIAFFVQVGLLVLLGLLTEKIRLRKPQDFYARMGLSITVFALLVQPLLGLLFGRNWSELESFGATPDPTVVATLGLLLMAQGAWRWLLLIIPLLWCVLSSATALAMSSFEALIPALAAVLVLVLLVLQTLRKQA